MKATSILKRLKNRAKREASHRKGYSELRSMSNEVREHAPAANQQPVMFFDASTRLDGLSLNAGFAVLSAWSLTLQGIPVVHFAC